MSWSVFLLEADLPLAAGVDPFADIPTLTRDRLGQPVARPKPMGADATRVARDGGKPKGDPTVAMGVGQGVWNTLVQGPVDMVRGVGGAVFGGMTAEEIDAPAARAAAIQRGISPTEIDRLVREARSVTARVCGSPQLPGRS